MNSRSNIVNAAIKINQLHLTSGMYNELEKDIRKDFSQIVGNVGKISTKKTKPVSVKNHKV